jgi:hypothetical protein
MKRFQATFGLNNLLRAVGGADGITVTLTPHCAVREDGALVTSVYAAAKVDAGPGAVVFVDPKGALFNGHASWRLDRQHQWAVFVFNGSDWDVFANQPRC